MTESQSTLSKSQEWAILISTILASSMAFIDSTALNVALPALQEDLKIEGTELLWIVNGYALFLSALLLVGGALGDLYGRKKIFGLGILIFMLSSVWCGISNSPLMLIVARCFQGIGGAMMVPGSLSLISALFPQEKRGWAIGTWSMFSAMTTVFGPALGGWLADVGLWRLVFFINVPLAVISLTLLIRKVPENKESEAGKLDILGAILATIALGGLTYGFIEAPDFGFGSSRILTALSLGVFAFVGFVFQEWRSSHPMMPLDLFRSRVFTSTNLITLFVYAALGGFLFFFPLNLIQVQGYPAKIAGLTMLPFGILIALLSGWSGKWADKVGVKLPLIIGPTITGIGFFMFSLPGITNGVSDFWTSFFPPVVLIGIGMGITVAPLTTAVMNSVRPQRTGTASGVNNTIARMAGVLAVAMMGSFALISFEKDLRHTADQLQLTAQSYQELEAQIPRLAEAKAPQSATKSQQDEINLGIKTAFVGAFKKLAVVAAGLALISALISLLVVKGKATATE